MTRFRAPLAGCLAILALISQMLAAPVHRMPAPTDVAGIAADLKAVFGDTAVLCVQAEDSGNPPAPARDCDDSCPLCQFHSGAHAFVLPTLSGLPARIYAGFQTPGLPLARASHRPAPTAFAQPRAPPPEA